MKNSPHKPPESLSEPAQAWWARLQAEYAIEDDAGLLLLQTALEAFDRMHACGEEIDRDGLQIGDRFGQKKPHPLLAAERDARSQMLAALKQLNLDLEPLRDRPGNPGLGGIGWKGNAQ